MSGYENVPVKGPTKARLDGLGKKGETYDELLNRLMDVVEVKRTA